jgi:tripartite-type tricarboxylate transporter receptor subunit TctC
MSCTPGPRPHSAWSGIAVIATLSFLAGAGGAAAQAKYPEKVIHIVAHTPPSGPGWIAARLIGDKLAVLWGQPVVVESKVGAGGNLAARYVARAAPDGYTLLMIGDAAIVTNLHLYKSMPYDPTKDLAPISQVAFTTNILAVPADLPVKSVQDLVALARSQPGNLTYAHAGLGFSQHLAAEVFKSTARIDVRRVDYHGLSALMPDLITGRVSMCFCNITAVLPLAKQSKLKALAVTSLKRSPFAPDLPTMAESGFPGFDVNAWFALMAPSGTPAPIIDKLYRETVRILALPDVRAWFDKLGMEVIGNSPAEFAAVIKEQIPQRKKVIEAAGITIQ